MCEHTSEYIALSQIIISKMILQKNAVAVTKWVTGILIGCTHLVVSCIDRARTAYRYRLCANIPETSHSALRS